MFSPPNQTGERSQHDDDHDDGVTACPVSRASAGLTEYLIVSSKPPTGYYVDGVTASPVSRASAGLTEYLIVSDNPQF